MQMKVTYIKHSGYLVETEKSYLLFDYWQGEVPRLNYDKNLYIFSSHAHHDHFSRDIYRLENACARTVYILSDDIGKADRLWRQAEHVVFMKEWEEKEIDGLKIRTLRSNDEGVAFLVKTEGKVIYHAGDLHWWDWPGEPDADNRYMKETYCKEMESLKGEEIDLAFVVLDPRQEESGSLGMTHFLSNVRARIVFPMHFWEDYTYVKNYIGANSCRFPASRLMVPEKPGQAFELDI